MNINQVNNTAFYDSVDDKNSKNVNVSADFREALAEVSDYVEDRIKNGPPKFQIGGCEYSVDEWKKLMESIDKDIENVKEEQQARFEKQEEELLEKELLEEEQIKEADIEKILQDREG